MKHVGISINSFYTPFEKKTKSRAVQTVALEPHVVSWLKFEFIVPFKIFYNLLIKEKFIFEKSKLESFQTSVGFTSHPNSYRFY